MRDTVNSVNNKISEINALIKNHIDIQKKIDSLDKCPTCHQEVSAHYKENIRKEKNLKINELNEKENMHKKGLKEADKKLKELEKEIEILRKKETEIKINKIRIKSLKEKENELNLLNTEQEQIKKKVGLINIEKMSVNKQIEELKHSNDEFARERKAIDNLNEKKNVLEKEKAVHETEKTQIFGVLNDLKKEIDKKIEIKNKINKNLQMQNWLEEFFVKLVSEIEKTIMANIYLQFNDLFEQWFNILIEDDTLNIRLDESFSPVVEQNDYEASIEHLSGGERTAAALAYRLALNRVINNMMSAIKTRDLIILDEPTDGFSSEQLDRVRDVLEQINAKQMIIVSHETKIESFVENTIRINKNEHVSRVV